MPELRRERGEPWSPVKTRPSLGGIASSSGNRRTVLGVHERPGPASKYVQTLDLSAARGDARPPAMGLLSLGSRAPFPTSQLRRRAPGR